MAELGVTVRKGVSIERISVKDGRAEGVVLDNELETFDHIVYSAPSPFLQNMLPEETRQEPYFQQISSQKYYGATCMVLALKKPFNPWFWTYVNDPRIPFVGVINYSDFTAWEGQEGRHVIYVPWYSETTEDPYTRDSDALIKDWVQGLKIVQPKFDESSIIEGVVGRAPYASMVCAGRYSERLVPLRGPIKDLTFANLSQIYPQDRGISIGIKLSRYAVKSVLEDREVEMDFSPHVSAEDVDF
jgi:protoporphyrinogen oxidase